MHKCADMSAETLIWTCGIDIHIGICEDMCIKMQKEMSVSEKWAHIGNTMNCLIVMKLLFFFYIQKNINKQVQAVILITFIIREHSIFSTKIVYLSGVMLDIFILLNNRLFHTL